MVVKFPAMIIVDVMTVTMKMNTTMKTQMRVTVNIQIWKCVLSHNGHTGCEPCTQQGVYLQAMTFPDLNAPLRTDNDFRTAVENYHQKSISPLTVLNIGMVSQFVLDPMHLLYLGVTRKFLFL